MFRFWKSVRKFREQLRHVLHSRKDDVIPFADSGELVTNSSLPPEKLIEVGNDHRLADEESLEAMLEACEKHCGSCGG